MAGMVQGTSARRRSSLAEINVTPLVDVMLVLLIISMVAAPMMQRGIQLELPQTRTAGPIDEARIVVSIDRESRIRLDRRSRGPGGRADARLPAAARPLPRPAPQHRAR